MLLLGFILLPLVLASPSFRYIPEHVFTMDVSLICQPAHVRLNISAVISIWEHDIITSDDFLDKVVLSPGNHFQYLFKHEEYGTVDPYLVIYHDCGREIVAGKCYAKTEFHFEEPREMGGTVYLQVDLLREHSEIVCDKGYPFGRVPPLQQQTVTVQPQQIQDFTSPKTFTP